MATTNASPGDEPADGATSASVRSIQRSTRHRHRAEAEGHGRQGLAFLWGLAAVALTALLAGAALHRTARPGEGLLAANGFLLTRIGTAAGVPTLSPAGVAARHLALYATLTGSFSRNDVLVPVGRELLALSAVLSAVLIWRVAYRLGLSHAAASVAIVLAALPLLFPRTALLDVPAQLAVPWSLAAAWAATADRRILRIVLALPALAVAALLAPVVLVPALAAAAVIAFPAGGLSRSPARSAGALGLGVAAAVLAGLLSAGHLGPETTRSPAGTAAMSTTAALVVSACFLLVGGIAASALSAFRAPAAALVAGALAALLPLDRPAMLAVCLPLAAVLAAALLSRLTAELAERSSLPVRRGVQAAWAVIVTVLAGGTVLSLFSAPVSGPSARGPADVVRWVRDELPAGAPVLAPPSEWAELMRAGADEKQFRLDGTGNDPHLAIVIGAPPPGAAVIARLPGDPGRPPLVLVDRQPGVPTKAELAQRQALAAALLANPTTTTGPRAARVLGAASVDDRLLTLLAGLGAQFGVGVRDLPPAAGGPSGALARHALIDRIGNQPLVPGSAATTRLLAWLSAQLPPFHPDSVQVVPGGVLIGFRYVSAPDAVVTAATR